MYKQKRYMYDHWRKLGTVGLYLLSILYEIYSFWIVKYIHSHIFWYTWWCEYISCKDLDHKQVMDFGDFRVKIPGPKYIYCIIIFSSHPKWLARKSTPFCDDTIFFKNGTNWMIFQSTFRLYIYIILGQFTGSKLFQLFVPHPCLEKDIRAVPSWPSQGQADDRKWRLGGWNSTGGFFRIRHPQKKNPLNIIFSIWWGGFQLFTTLT